MTRAEYNEFRSIRATLRKLDLNYGTTLTVRTDASPEYKHKLDEFYTSLDFHPVSIRVDRHFFDDKERIHYIKGLEWQDYEGNAHRWEELYSQEERTRFLRALD